LVLSFYEIILNKFISTGSYGNHQASGVRYPDLTEKWMLSGRTAEISTQKLYKSTARKS